TPPCEERLLTHGRCSRRTTRDSQWTSAAQPGTLQDKLITGGRRLRTRRCGEPKCGSSRRSAATTMRWSLISTCIRSSGRRLSREPMHSCGISQRLTLLSQDGNSGSLFPSRYCLEQDAKLKELSIS